MTVEHPDETEIPDTTDDGGEIDADIDERTAFLLGMNYRILTAARRELDRAAQRARFDAPDTAEWGMATQALRTAEDAIFGALNVLSSYCDDEEAREAIKQSPALSWCHPVVNRRRPTTVTRTVDNRDTDQLQSVFAISDGETTFVAGANELVDILRDIRDLLEPEDRVGRRREAEAA